MHHQRISVAIWIRYQSLLITVTWLMLFRNHPLETQEFYREFSPLEVSGLAFSYIGVVPSIVSVLFYAIPNGGPFAMVWGWAIACPFIMCIGLAMAELASSATTSGGLYYWTYLLASPRCRNFLSWIVGYSNTIETITGHSSDHAVELASAYTASNAQLYGIYAALVLSHAVLVSFGTKVLTKLQGLCTLMNACLCLIIIIALPIATPPDYRNSASLALGDFTNSSGWPSGFAFILSLMAPLQTIGGYDASVHMSEEASNAASAIPWAIVRINVSLAFCMGTDVGSVFNSPIGQPMAQILFNSLGQKKAFILWRLIISAEYMVASNCLLVGSRQTFAFAHDGALPLSRYLYRINRYTETPVNTVWFGAVCVLAIGLLSFVSAQAINAVFSIAVTASYIAFITPITTHFAFKNNFKPGPFYLGRLVGELAAIRCDCCGVFFFPATPQTTTQEMNYTVVVLGGFLFLAVSWYYCPVENRSEDWMLEKEQRDADIFVSVVDV
ncbi:amino acid/polyamine transporter I [Suillus occidentalis]|nr:amino acid/polyamine transporter I [Suillus occidentalis]